MRGTSLELSCLLLALVASIGAEYLLPDSSFIFRHCLGPSCPTFSVPVPVNVNKPDAQHPVNCTKGEVIPHPTECQSLYFCNRNGTGIKLTCTFGYAYHPKLRLCVPKALVKSCGGVYCPPSILIGMVPDPQTCTRFYKCVYGFAYVYQCEPEHVYDEELGKCIAYSRNDIPSCVNNEEDIPGTETENTTTTTEAVETINTTTTTEAVETGSTTTTTEAVTTPIDELMTTSEEPLPIPTTSDSPTLKL